MTETKHTPGPWEVEANGVDAFDIKSVEYGGIALIHDPIAPETHRMEEVEANAHLMAASPELLAACEWLAAEYCEEGCNTDHPEYTKALTAIAKAKP